MSGRQNLVQLGVYGAVVLSTVVGAIILGWQGTLDSAAITAIFGAAVGFAGGAAAGQGAVFTAVNGKSIVSAQLLAEQGANTRTAIVAAAAQPSNVVQPVEPTHAVHEET